MIEVIGLSKTYAGREIVNEVSISVSRGEVVGLLGPSGSGKTTLISMISGFVAPDRGRIVLDGRDISNTPMFERARLGIGYLSQHPSLFPALTVKQNVLLALEAHMPSRRERDTALERLLTWFSIQHIANVAAAKLSGGERKRAEIARSVANRPAYILLDEPFAGIDPVTIIDIQRLVRAISRLGIGILISDHNVRETLVLVDRAYILSSGTLRYNGTPQALVGSQDARRDYLGSHIRL